MLQAIRKYSIYSFVVFVLSLCLVVSCKDEDEDPVVNETGTMMDAEGNVYMTVKIGNQWWMAENLKVTKYRNGTGIAKITDSTDWVSQSSGAYCEFNNGNGNLKGPGLLYNWHAVNNADKIAPEGWHIPTDAEWKTLETTIGMSNAESDKLAWRGSDEGDKLKTSNQDEWAAFGDIFSTNESGFTALAGSCRLFNSLWGDPGLKSTGFWWTASSYNTDEAWYRHLDYKNSNVFRSHADQHYGFSIRCVKD